MKVHIVTYTCEQCGATQTCQTGMGTDGMCAVCGSPMKIDDLFGDRRIVTLPVEDDRREHAA
jgi:transcription initiation factor IIE alpha subunit